MESNRIHICAHRGASGTYPENTTLAFEVAAWMGATMLEFDVRVTSDRRCVILHDPTVDRTTNGTGKLGELTFERVRALDAGRGQRIPTLDEALDFTDRMILNIQAYPETDGDRDVMGAALLEAFAKRKCHGRAFVTAHNVELMRRLRQEDPAIRLCNLNGQRDPDYVRIALDHHPCEIIQPNWAITTPELVAEAHRHGLKVNPFYADTEEEMRRQAACGVDGILTNFPQRMAPLDLRKAAES